VNHVKIVQAGPDAARLVVDLVVKLLRELGEEGDEAGSLSVAELAAGWRANENHHCAFLAYADNGSAIGVATLSIAFALYANGNYGIINEMYVAPEHRSQGVGASLIEAIKSYGREQGWHRIDVTAPESQRWARAKAFYEYQGFAFTGPKLKHLLS
jgi:GNAT superfamily N-acetyltransferase